MARKVNDIISLCCEISAKDDIKVAATTSASGAVLVGGMVAFGAVLAGPPGIFFGGVIGGLLGGWLTRGQFLPLPQILMALPFDQKRKLSKDLMNILGNLQWKDAAELITIVVSSKKLRDQVKSALRNYVTTKL
ncbi:protein C19orf12 homolog isoform X1 [Nerophis ophidion]|uniref:protein C19orf12 homolog isoform X1 n=1 Tax=Nerophis ophidion TaxID=159077 RepID=UPI002ADF90BC|nr:protein C19orf12 homolog isoform X1 [Nerophis ophidion]